MKTSVINICSGEPYDVYIGRKGHGESGYFGNPFVPENYHGTEAQRRQQCLADFRWWFLRRLDNDPEFRRRVLALRGRTLGCFCKPRECHGDVIAEWLDAQPEA